MSEQISQHSINVEQKNTTDYMVFHNIEAHFRHKENLLRWPLHITIAPPFEIDSESRDIKRLRSLLREIADDFKPFTVYPREKVMFGPDHNRPATRLESQDNNLHALHERFLWDLGSVGCSSIDMTYAGERYTPHFTWQRGVFARDQPFTCDSLSIAKRDNGIKQIVDTQLLFR